MKFIVHGVDPTTGIEVAVAYEAATAAEAEAKANGKGFYISTVEEAPTMPNEYSEEVPTSRQPEVSSLQSKPPQRSAKRRRVLLTVGIVILAPVLAWWMSVKDRLFTDDVAIQKTAVSNVKPTVGPVSAKVDDSAGRNTAVSGIANPATAIGKPFVTLAPGNVPELGSPSPVIQPATDRAEIDSVPVAKHPATPASQPVNQPAAQIASVLVAEYPMTTPSSPASQPVAQNQPASFAGDDAASAKKQAKIYLDEATTLATKARGALRASALVKIARAKIEAGDTDGGGTLLQEAKDAAKDMPKGFARKDLIRSIIEAQTDARQFDEAEATFRQLTTADSESLNILQTLCEGLCKADRTGAALTWLAIAEKEADLSSAPAVEARVYLAIAKSALRADFREHFDKSLQSAREAIAVVAEPSTKVDLLCETAKLQAKAKDTADAEETLKKALEAARAVAKDDWGGRSRALAEVAAAEADTGNADSEATFREAVEASGAVENAARRTVVLQDIARMQAKVGAKKEAIRTVKIAAGLVDMAPDEPIFKGPDAIASGTWRGVAADVVAQTLAENGEFDEALRMARSIKGYQRATAQANVAAELAKAGKAEEARVAIAEALQAVPLAQREMDKAAALLAIGLAQVQAGDYEGARKTAKDGEVIEPYLGVQIYIAAAKAVILPQSGMHGKQVVSQPSFQQATPASQPIVVRSATQETSARPPAVHDAKEAPNYSEKYRQVARKLISSAASEALPASHHDRVSVYIRLATVNARVGNSAEADRCFAVARSEAKELPGLGLPNIELENQIGDYADIAEGQIKTGKAEQAAVSLGDAKKALSRLDGFGGASVMSLAIAQAHAGDFAGARQTEGRVSPPAREVQQWSVLSATAETKAKMGDFRGAITTLRQITDGNWAEGEIAQLIRIQIEAGHLDDARATISSIDGIAKDLAYVAIAEAQAKAGDCVAAKATADLIKGSASVEAYAAVVRRQVRSGNLSAAKATADGIPNDRWSKMVRVEIAIAQAEMGDPLGANTAAASFDEDDRSKVSAAIAEAQAAAGNADAALATATRISDSYRKRCAYIGIAKAQARAGQVDAAEQTIRNSPYTTLEAAEELVRE